MIKKTLFSRLLYAYTHRNEKEEYYVHCPKCKREGAAEVIYRIQPYGESLHHWDFYCLSCGFKKNGFFSVADQMIAVLWIYAIVITFCAVIFKFFPAMIDHSPWFSIMLFSICVLILGGWIHMYSLQKIITARITTELKHSSHEAGSNNKNVE